jgi:hypothetical protein
MLSADISYVPPEPGIERFDGVRRVSTDLRRNDTKRISSQASCQRLFGAVSAYDQFQTFAPLNRAAINRPS